jgi:hypothetical protein
MFHTGKMFALLRTSSGVDLASACEMTGYTDSWFVRREQSAAPASREDVVVYSNITGWTKLHIASLCLNYYAHYLTEQLGLDSTLTVAIKSSATKENACTLKDPSCESDPTSSLSTQKPT